MWWPRTDMYGYANGYLKRITMDTRTVIHLVLIRVFWISTQDIHVNIQLGYPRYPNSGNISLELGGSYPEVAVLYGDVRICLDIHTYPQGPNSQMLYLKRFFRSFWLGSLTSMQRAWEKQGLKVNATTWGVSHWIPIRMSAVCVLVTDPFTVTQDKTRYTVRSTHTHTHTHTS